MGERLQRVNDHLGNVWVVSDKFHIKANVVEAFYPEQKAGIRADAGKRNWLGRTRWMRLQSRVNWTEKEAQKWESMALERCVTGMAYDLRLVLQGVYEWKDAAEGSGTFQKLVCEGSGDAGIDRVVASTDGLSCTDG